VTEIKIGGPDNPGGEGNMGNKGNS